MAKSMPPKGPRRSKNTGKAANILRLSLFWAIVIVGGLALIAIFNPPENLIVLIRVKLVRLRVKAVFLRLRKRISKNLHRNLTFKAALLLYFVIII